MFDPTVINDHPRQISTSGNDSTGPFHQQPTGLGPRRFEDHPDDPESREIQKQTPNASLVRLTSRLGGKDHFAADRASGDAIAAAFPGVRTAALANRRFLERAVAYLAGETGIRQFLDVGVGLPFSPNTHEIAQGIAADCRVVYVDNDPVVLAHARALLTSSRQGRTAFLDADLRDPASILTSPQLRRTLDLGQPVGLLLVAVLHFLPDDEAAQAVAALRDALAPGSYIVLSHGTDDYMTSRDTDQIPALTKTDPAVFRPRSRAAIAAYVAGLHLVDPAPAPHDSGDPVVIDSSGRGLVSVARWRHDGDTPPDEEVACYGVAARAGVPADPTSPPEGGSGGAGAAVAVPDGGLSSGGRP
jgi:SAM-dependent methyltransferase